MRNFLIILILISINIDSLAQDANLNSFQGAWKWSEGTEELTIELRLGTFEIPAIFGGGTKECLIGGYKYTKNGVTIANNINELQLTKRSIDYPIRVLWNLTVTVRDPELRNPKGEFKLLGGSSKIVPIGNGSTIRWVLTDDEEHIYSTEDEIFPEGTSLPTNIILTKVE